MFALQLSSPTTIPHNGAAVLSLDLPSRNPVTVVVRGELDMSTTHLLTGLVQDLARDRPQRVVLDLAGVTFFCADGIRALLQARDTIAATGGELALRAPSERTWRVLTITHTADLFSLDPGTTPAG